ncbi:hypothetical protein FGE12_20375 [Aggregicoccus sp. 17bor-14]|uniref:hypothetical protein n=1 Tax=Myxococcaceae TaxID=31 RepID=UPI00129C5505|nr:MULTISPECIES: hypothetical protein [Myxococcaceae]MBF5044766.1 hypothetical protein [Simulacricoccus sp. 17bor-14]MRI90510.1 hypothetical protein [Aggregicoccus sp. 17bor-14]
MPDAGRGDGGLPDAGAAASTSFERVIGAVGQDEGRSVAVAPDGDVLVASTHFVALPDFGGGRQPERGTAALSRFSARGMHRWTYAEWDERTCGGGEPCITSGLNARATAVDRDGRAALATVRHEEGSAFGEYLLRETPRLTVLDADGHVLWTRVIQGPAGGADVSDLGFDREGNLLAWGHVGGPGWDFGDGQPHGVALQEVSFLASYSRQGELRWAKVFGDARGVSRSNAMAMTPDGDVVLAGEMAGRLSFGGPELVDNEGGQFPEVGSPVPSRPFVVRLGSDGAHRWSRVLDTFDAEVKDLAVSAHGVALGGRFHRRIVFAGKTIDANFTEGGVADGFVAVMGLDGEERWATSLRSSLDAPFFGVGWSPDGDVWTASAMFDRAWVGEVEIPGAEGDEPRLVLALLRGEDGVVSRFTAPRRGGVEEGDLAVDSRGVVVLAGAVTGGKSCGRGCGGALELLLLQRVP